MFMASRPGQSLAHFPPPPPFVCSGQWVPDWISSVKGTSPLLKRVHQVLPYVKTNPASQLLTVLCSFWHFCDHPLPTLKPSLVLSGGRNSYYGEGTACPRSQARWRISVSGRRRSESAMFCSEAFHDSPLPIEQSPNSAGFEALASFLTHSKSLLSSPRGHSLPNHHLLVPGHSGHFPSLRPNSVSHFSTCKVELKSRHLQEVFPDYTIPTFMTLGKHLSNSYIWGCCLWRRLTGSPATHSQLEPRPGPSLSSDPHPVSRPWDTSL